MITKYLLGGVVVIALCAVGYSIVHVPSQVPIPDNQASSTPASSTVSNGATTTPAATTPPVTTSGIRGTVTIGPTCPVMYDPPQDACNDKPFQTTLAITQNEKIITTVSSDTAGRFSIVLKPGTYVIKNAKPGLMPALSPQTIVVKAGSMTEINLQFDSGIR